MTWRADLHDHYWFVGSDLKVYPEVDAHDTVDDSRYEAGNYFFTRTEAVKAAGWIHAGMGYMRGDHMDGTIERLIEARRIVEKVGTVRREP